MTSVDNIQQLPQGPSSLLSGRQLTLLIMDRGSCLCVVVCISAKLVFLEVMER